jgi:hypothetical protein
MHLMMMLMKKEAVMKKYATNAAKNIRLHVNKY